MKTRTLLLLALACGVAIMLAGAVFFIQLSTQDEVAPATPLGEQVAVGDMLVTVAGIAESDGALDVTLHIGGVDDLDGALGFRLIASGRGLSPVPGDGRCAATTEAEQTCVLRFDTSQADGHSRVLFYERGDDRARWVLA